MTTTKRTIAQKALLLLLFFVPGSLLLYSDNKVLTAENKTIPLAVRVFEEVDPSSGLKKDDFKLFINNKRSEIINLTGKEKSIGKPPALGRNFILSFSMLSYNKELEEGLAFFVTDILRPADSLILLTPRKTYQLKVTANREGMIREIVEKLQKDCRRYFKTRMTEEKYLIGKIKNLYSTLNGTMVRNYFRTLFSFLETFPREFLKFKEHFLLPSAERHRQVLDLLQSREGERWWIHIQAFDIQKLLTRVRKMVDVVNYFLTNRVWTNTGLRVAMKKKFTYLHKQLFSTGIFVEEDFLNTFVAGDITYNVIFSVGAQKSEASPLNRISSDLRGIYSRTAVRSGGAVVAAKPGKLEAGLIKIKDHVDFYYDLVFDFDGKIDEKQFRLEMQNKAKKPVLVYRKGYKKEELEELVRYRAKGKVKIVDFSREKSLICFSVKSFRLNKPKKKEESFGLLKVIVELVDSRGEKVYSSRNTLRATKEQLDIKLPLPLEPGVKLELLIKVNDLVANSTASFSRSVTLK